MTSLRLELSATIGSGYKKFVPNIFWTKFKISFDKNDSRAPRLFSYNNFDDNFQQAKISPRELIW
jgi:hypothetical protein